MKNSILLASIAIILAIPNVFSQNNLSVHLGPSIPIAKYARLNSYSVGNPAIGATAGLLFTHISKNGLGLFIETDLHYNDIVKSFKDAQFDNSGGEIVSYFDEYTFSKYLNLPISTGIMYRHHENEKIALFGSLGFVINFLKITNSTIKGTSYDHDFSNTYDRSFKYDVSRGYGFILGAGMQYNKVLVKFNYISSWQNDINRNVISINNYSDLGLITNEYSSQIEAKVDLISLTLGYKFL